MFPDSARAKCVDCSKHAINFVHAALLNAIIIFVHTHHSTPTDGANQIICACRLRSSDRLLRLLCRVSHKQAQHQVQRALLLDAVLGESAFVLELLGTEL